MMPSDDELAQIQTDIEAATLPGSGGVILSASLTPDGQGGNTEAWGTATTGLAYRLDPVRGDEQTSGGALRPYFTYVLSLPHGTSIAASNRFYDGTHTFDVKSVDAGKSWSGQVRAYVERL